MFRISNVLFQNPSLEAFQRAGTSLLTSLAEAIGLKDNAYEITASHITSGGVGILSLRSARLSIQVFMDSSNHRTVPRLSFRPLDGGHSETKYLWLSQMDELSRCQTVSALRALNRQRAALTVSTPRKSSTAEFFAGLFA